MKTNSKLFSKIFDQKKKNAGGTNNSTSNAPSYGCRPKSLGQRRGLNSPFILPIKDAKSNEGENNGVDKKKIGNNDEQEKVVGKACVFKKLFYYLN
jgi:hypothetical protein